MQLIYDVINKIGEFLSAIWNFINTTIEWTIEVVSYISKAMTLAYDFIDSFPTWIKAFAVLTIAVSIIYTILGRAGGNSE